MCSNAIPWDSLFDNGIQGTTQDVEEIMRGYCDQIAISSGERVHARFEELKMAKRTTGGGIAGISTYLTQQEEVYQANALPQRDINELFDPRTYVFDIYNEMYQFRLCDLTYGAAYPIEVVMDDGVEGEVIDKLQVRFGVRSSSGAYTLSDEDQLKECFRLMITSRKAKSILYRLCRE